MSRLFSFLLFTAVAILAAVYAAVGATTDSYISSNSNNDEASSVNLQRRQLIVGGRLISLMRNSYSPNNNNNNNNNKDDEESSPYSPLSPPPPPPPSYFVSRRRILGPGFMVSINVADPNRSGLFHFLKGSFKRKNRENAGFFHVTRFNGMHDIGFGLFRQMLRQSLRMLNKVIVQSADTQTPSNSTYAPAPTSARRYKHRFIVCCHRRIPLSTRSFVLRLIRGPALKSNNKSTEKKKSKKPKKKKSKKSKKNKKKKNKKKKNKKNKKKNAKKAKSKAKKTAKETEEDVGGLVQDFTPKKASEAPSMIQQDHEAPETKKPKKKSKEEKDTSEAEQESTKTEKKTKKSDSDSDASSESKSTEETPSMDKLLAAYKKMKSLEKN